MTNAGRKILRNIVFMKKELIANNCDVIFEKCVEPKLSLF